ncbi:MAG: helix-turn-helix transcriptional regulator, partial [Candidatus Omnitrophica bacterium]|nr:helix-turn-helix transcriptional regulator [Candidatus Omnitrophota bacterium]
MKLFKRSLPTLILEVLSDGPEFGYEIAKRIKRMEPGVLDNQEALLYPDLYE